MISLFSFIKENFYRTAVNILSRGACKARKSVIIDPYTYLPDSNNLGYIFGTFAHTAQPRDARFPIFCFFSAKVYVFSLPVEKNEILLWP